MLIRLCFSRHLSKLCPQSDLGCNKSLSGHVEEDKPGLFCGMKVISEVLLLFTAVSSQCYYCQRKVSLLLS